MTATNSRVTAVAAKVKRATSLRNGLIGISVGWDGGGITQRREVRQAGSLSSLISKIVLG